MENTRETIREYYDEETSTYLRDVRVIETRTETEEISEHELLDMINETKAAIARLEEQQRIIDEASNKKDAILENHEHRFLLFEKEFHQEDDEEPLTQ